MTPSLHPILRRLRLVSADLAPALRRTVDVLGAGLGLLLLAPLLGLVALLIKLESRGPVLYSQLRGGLHGRPFRMWKLRSMVVDSDTFVLMPTKPPTSIHRRLAPLGSGARAHIARTLASPACSTLIARPCADVRPESDDTFLLAS